MNSSRGELKQFLKARRERLTPAELGITVQGRRRTTGLTREDMAKLVGVSFKWYSLFEAGSAAGVSAGFVDRVATVLRLTEFERDYLITRLGLSRRHESPHSTAVPDFLCRLIDAHAHLPSCIYSRHMDILHANEAYERIFGRFPDASAPGRNKVWRVFTEDRKRGIWRDWNSIARHTVKALRYLNAAAADGPAFHGFVENLFAVPDFRRLWTEQSLDVFDPASWRFGLDVPGIGALDFDFTTLMVPDFPDMFVVMLVPANTTTASRMNNAMLAKPDGAIHAGKRRLIRSMPG
jgi:transcriptional regulator with XRE-family HTH domain